MRNWLIPTLLAALPSVASGQDAPPPSAPKASPPAAASTVPGKRAGVSSIHAARAIKGATTPRIRAAYGDYMTAWDSALKGIRKSERESVDQYRKRQKKVEDQLNELQSRLEAASPG